MAAQACHDSQTMTKSAPGAAEDSTVSSGVEMCESSVSESCAGVLVKAGDRGKVPGPEQIPVRRLRVMEGDFL